jgi:hypothetical protein
VLRMGATGIWPRMLGVGILKSDNNEGS